jgi:hypothetical protein
MSSFIQSFIHSFVPAFIGAIIPAIINYIIYKRNKNKRDVNFSIDRLNALFNGIEDKPYVTIKILEKNYKKRYVKYGVAISDEGIADVLLEGSPLDEMHRLLNIHNSIMKDIQKPIKVEIVVI